MTAAKILDALDLMNYPTRIIEQRDGTGWITAIIAGRWCQAKVYGEPSTYGINDGCVSKLAICKTEYREEREPFHPQLCYNYDRGVDFDHAPPGLVNRIVGELERICQCKKETIK